jgi:hypothetical protein
MRRFSVVLALAVASLVATTPVAQGASTTCDTRVQFGLVDARTTGCLNKTAGKDEWRTIDTVRLNGLPLEVVSGQLVLRGPQSSGKAGGTISGNVRLSIAGATIHEGLLKRSLPAGGPGEEQKLGSFAPPAGQSLRGLGFHGSVAIRIGKGRLGNGYALLSPILKLPSLFRIAPTNGGPLTGTVLIRADASGVHADTLKLAVTNAYVGHLLLRNLCLSYTSGASSSTPCAPPAFGTTPLNTCTVGAGQDRWDGSALVMLPTKDRTQIGVFAGLTQGGFSYAGGQVTNLGKRVPLAKEVYLDKVGVALCTGPPLTLRGAAGIRFGPEFAGHHALYLDGSFQYTDGNPWSLEARGALSVFDRNVANGFLKFQSNGSIDLAFDANLNYGGVLDVSARVSGWYQPARDERWWNGFDLDLPMNRQRWDAFVACVLDTSCPPAERAQTLREVYKIPPKYLDVHVPTAFDVVGSGSVCVVDIVCTSGDIAVSSVGVAGCASMTVFGYPEPYLWGVEWHEVRVRAGAGHRWGGGVDVMGQSCDVGSYRATRSAYSVASRATTVHLPRAVGIVLRMKGKGAPPKVVLVGPHGRRIDATSKGELRRDDHFFVENDADDTTTVFVAHPTGGAWRIREQPGSARVVSVSQALAHPDPSVAARVLRRPGGGRLLEYALETDPDHEVTLFDRGPGYQRDLGRAGGRVCLRGAKIRGHRPKNAVLAHPRILCGAIPFHPTPGPAGKRTIVAVVTNHGELVREVTVASYHAAGPKLPGRPRHVRVTRRRGAVIVTWDRVPRASSYDVDLFVSDGRRLLDVEGRGRRRAVVRGIARSLDVTVRVAGVRSDEVEGPAARARSAGAAR